MYSCSSINYIRIRITSLFLVIVIMSRERGAPFLGVMDRPMNTNIRIGGAGAPGMTVNQFQDRAPEFPGAALGADASGTGGWVKGMTDYYDNTTNGFSTYHCSQTFRDHQFGDTGKAQFTFGRTTPKSQKLETDQRLTGQDMYGVSILNFLMQHDPRFRRLYGRMRDGAEVMQHWNYKGVQVPEQVGLNSFEGTGAKPHASENAFVIFGRVRIPNIFLAENKRRAAHVGEGMQAHLILRRHKYVGNQAAQAEAWTPRDPVMKLNISAGPPGGPTIALRANQQTPIDNPDFDPCMMMPGFTADVAEPVIMDDDAKTGFGAQTKRIDWCMDGGNNDADDEPGQEYYWSFDPYVSETGTNPDPEYYVNSFGRGLYINVGMIYHALRGPNNYTPEQAAWAQAALYPAQRGRAYLKALNRIDVIELFVRVAPKFT